MIRKIAELTVIYLYINNDPNEVDEWIESREIWKKKTLECIDYLSNDGFLESQFINEDGSFDYQLTQKGKATLKAIKVLRKYWPDVLEERIKDFEFNA